MQLPEVRELATLLHALYEDRFPGLSPQMCVFWLERLRHLEPDLVTAAVQRWASHHTFKSPSLDELLEQVELVRDAQQPLTRTGSSTKSYLEVLQDAADAQAGNPERTEDDASYGHLMVQLAMRSIDPWQDGQGVTHPKLTLQERTAQCYDWATQYASTRPQLATDLQAAARQFAKGDDSDIPF